VNSQELIVVIKNHDDFFTTLEIEDILRALDSMSDKEMYEVCSSLIADSTIRSSKSIIQLTQRLGRSEDLIHRILAFVKNIEKEKSNANTKDSRPTA
jgi:hypothetical protein